LVQLPLEQRLTLPDGTQVLLVHAAPGTDDGLGVRRDHSDDDLRGILANCNADLVFVGHTHIPLDKIIDGVRVVNIGSISNPNTPDLRASYVTLGTTNDGYNLDFHRVDYDHNAVIENIHAVKHPTPDYLISFMQGKQLSDIFKKSQS
jgi:predicted phosphodiesterase